MVFAKNAAVNSALSFPSKRQAGRPAEIRKKPEVGKQQSVGRKQVVP
ncbi:MAG: hypothetical protein KKG93_13365 [Bacteroidetes bacterium]|nr:hypothetical protein [Bacteroidota bacterium]